MSRPALPERRVSRNRKVGAGKRREVAMAIIKREGALASCSCGWAGVHPRPKARDNKAQRHLDKRHNGEGLWF